MNQMPAVQNSTDYMQDLDALGLMEGRPGAQQLNPNVSEVINALHHVLAGGEAKVTIAKEGNPAIVEELGNKRSEAIRVHNYLRKNKDIVFLP